jgi:galactose mutarotase-like enzyme
MCLLPGNPKFIYMYNLENDLLRISINAAGAELNSIVHKKHQLEYLWNGDPAFWAKHSPILFPIVGTLKQDTYYYNNRPYHLPRHGFARTLDFSLADQKPDELVFLLHDNAQTKTVFPFSFNFFIRYKLINDVMQVTYEIFNTGDDEMYFSVGGHPAFAVPLIEGTAYEDYSLEFNQTENAPRWPITADGLISLNPAKFFEETNRIQLKKELFNKDALVFKGLKSTTVKLSSPKTEHGWEFNFEGFPYLGIWAAKGADFVCVEPWCGIADAENTNQQFKEKEGIIRLASSRSFGRSWMIRFY